MDTTAGQSGRKGLAMRQQVVHFEIIGRDPAELRSYYGELFGWGFETGDASTEAVSEPGNHGFVDGSETGGGINGGVGGGKRYERRVLFYVGVPDVEAALKKAESLGGGAGWAPRELPDASWSGSSPIPRGI
jgi:predicted enzyme related to lactoylglutathione lyase